MVTVKSDRGKTPFEATGALSDHSSVRQEAVGEVLALLGAPNLDAEPRKISFPFSSESAAIRVGIAGAAFGPISPSAVAASRRTFLSSWESATINAGTAGAPTRRKANDAIPGATPLSSVQFSSESAATRVGTAGAPILPSAAAAP